MSMEHHFSAEEIAALRMSFLRFITVSDAVSHTLYSNLFAQNPGLQGMFSSDPKRQEEKLVHTLAVMLDLIERKPEFESYSAALGDKHKDYGVVPEMYVSLRGLLIEALDQHLIPPLTDEERVLWAKLYDAIAAAMTA